MKPWNIEVLVLCMVLEWCPLACVWLTVGKLVSAIAAMGSGGLGYGAAISLSPAVWSSVTHSEPGYPHSLSSVGLMTAVTELFF